MLRLGIFGCLVSDLSMNSHHETLTTEASEVEAFVADPVGFVQLPVRLWSTWAGAFASARHKESADSGEASSAASIRGMCKEGRGGVCWKSTVAPVRLRLAGP
jgi:hypothetical protein